MRSREETQDSASSHTPLYWWQAHLVADDGDNVEMINESKERDFSEHDRFTVEVQYPPLGLQYSETPTMPSTWHINAHRRAACRLTNLPPWLNDVDCKKLFEDYTYLERIVLVRSQTGEPTGSVFLFGPLAFIRMIVGWAPNVSISDYNIYASPVINETDFERIFGLDNLKFLFNKENRSKNVVFTPSQA